MATYYFNKQRTNYARLCCAIVGLSAGVLRDILGTQVFPTHVKNKIRRCAETDRRSAGLTPNQFTCINNAATVGSYEEFDITLLYVVLRLLSVQDLRNTLEIQITPKDIYTTVRNCPALTTDPGTKLTFDEINTIKHAATYGSYESCKDELLLKLLKYLCPSSYPTIHPTIPWGIHNMPDPSHITLGDDIERIHVMRNTVYGHISTTEIADQAFNAHWNCLGDIMTRLDRRYPGNDYTKRLDDVKYSSMDEAQEKFWWDQMKKLAEKETLTSNQIAESNTKIDNLSKTTAEQFEESNAKIDNLSKTTTEQFEESNAKFDNLSKTTAEQFEESNSKIDNLSKTTAEQYEESNTKIDNLSKTTAEQFEESNAKIDNLSQTTAKQFKESYARIDNLSKTTSEKLEESNTKIDILSEMTTEQFEESKTKIEILYKRTDEQVNKIDNLSKTTTEQFEESMNRIDRLSKKTAENFQESNTKIQNLSQETAECSKRVEALSKMTSDSLSEVKSDIHSIHQSTATILDETKLPTLVKTCFENTLALINEHSKDKTFYVRSCVQEGLQVLKNEGILILTGKGGDGKTKCSLEIMKQIYEEDRVYIVLDIETIDKWDELVSADRKTLVRLDDPIGKSNTESTLYKKCERFWDKIYACVKSGKTKVILTIREYILKENQQDLQKYELFDERHKLNLSKYENGFTEKREMFELHCRQNNIEICDCSEDENFESKAALSKTVTVRICIERVDDIIDADPFIGFPQACFLFCKNRKYTRLGALFFEHPSESLIKALKSMRESTDHREKMKYCIMSYMILNDGVVDFESLDHVKMSKVKESIDLTENYKWFQYEDAMEGVIDLYVCKKPDEPKESNVREMNLRTVRGCYIPVFSYNMLFIDQFFYNIYRLDKGVMKTTSVSLQGDPQTSSDDEDEEGHETSCDHSYCFSHETIVEAVAVTFSVCNIELLLELCPWKCIDEFVRPNTYMAKEGEVVIKIKPTHYQYLVKRISVEIQNNRFDWLHHSMLKTEDFLEHLIESDGFMSSMRTNMENVFVEACKKGLTVFLDWVWRNCRDDFVSIDLSFCLNRVIDDVKEYFSTSKYTADAVTWMLQNVTGLKKSTVIKSIIYFIRVDATIEQSTAFSVMAAILKSDEYRSIVSSNSVENHDIFSVALTCGSTPWLDIIWKHFQTELRSHDIGKILQKTFKCPIAVFSVWNPKRLRSILWLMKNMDNIKDQTIVEIESKYLTCDDINYANLHLVTELVDIIAKKAMNDKCLQDLFKIAVQKNMWKLVDELWKKFKLKLSSLDLTTLLKVTLEINQLDESYKYLIRDDIRDFDAGIVIWFLHNVQGIQTEVAEQALLTCLYGDQPFIDDLLDEYKQVACNSCSKYNGMFIEACTLKYTYLLDDLWNKFQSSILSNDISEQIVTLCKRQIQTLNGIFKHRPCINIDIAVWLLQHIPEWHLTNEAIEELILCSMSNYKDPDLHFDLFDLIVLIMNSERFKHVVKLSCENMDGLFVQACRLENVEFMSKLWENFKPSIIKCNYSDFLIKNRTYMKVLEDERDERIGVSLRADVMVWFLKRAATLNLSVDAVKSSINRCMETLGVCQKHINYFRIYGTELSSQFVSVILSSDNLKRIVAHSCQEEDGIWKMACELDLENIQKSLIEHFPDSIPGRSS